MPGCLGGGGDEVTAGLLCALLDAWAGWPLMQELRHLLELVA
jgi:hypothetical protein